MSCSVVPDIPSSVSFVSIFLLVFASSFHLFVLLQDLYAFRNREYHYADVQHMQTMSVWAFFPKTISVHLFHIIPRSEWRLSRDDLLTDTAWPSSSTMTALYYDLWKNIYFVDRTDITKQSGTFRLSACGTRSSSVAPRSSPSLSARI